jgi:exonuclease SbcD
MRILHTSDWHLGVRHGAVSRGPDHDHFLAWLTQTLAEREVDVLVVAGDVFDAMQPSAGALSRYYRFLAQVAASGVAQVLIVGGNHDSASRLDAPSEVLSALDVHVVGGIGAAEESWARCVVPLRTRSGEVEAVALAVPYVHEFRLGVRTTDPDHALVRAQFRERFGAVYTHLVDLARARFPGLPLVATGHLTLGRESTRDDYPQQIHQVGSLEGLPVSLLDPRIQYTALGHIHRSYPVDPERRAWYSGSPVAFSLPEAKTPRKVLLVDVNQVPDGKAEVTALTVPAPRALLELRGAPDALLAEVKGLRWPEPLPPLLFCRVVADTLPAGLLQALHDALGAFDEGQRPSLVELRQERSTPLAFDGAERVLPALGDLKPAEVLRTLCEARGRDDTEALGAAFGTLAGATDDDFRAMLDDVRLPE